MILWAAFLLQYRFSFNHFDEVGPCSYQYQRDNEKLRPLRHSRSGKVINGKPICGSLVNYANHISALHAMQTRSSDENSVRPSIRPSINQ